MEMLPKKNKLATRVKVKLSSESLLRP